MDNKPNKPHLRRVVLCYTIFIDLPITGVKLSQKVMSKNTNSKLDTSPRVGYSSGYIIDNHQVEALVGKLLTFVETMGFSDAREKAVKDVVRQYIYNTLLTPCFIISGEDRTALAEKYSHLDSANSINRVTSY